MVFSHCVPSLTVSVSVQVDATDSNSTLVEIRSSKTDQIVRTPSENHYNFCPPSYKLVYNPHEYSSCEF